MYLSEGICFEIGKGKVYGKFNFIAIYIYTFPHSAKKNYVF
jgi:hypothetical protein